MDATAMWMLTGAIQLVIIVIMTGVYALYQYKISQAVSSIIEPWPAKVMVRTGAVVGCTIVVLMMIIGPLWLSTVDQWVFSSLGGLVATSAYTIVSRTGKRLNDSMVQMIEDRTKEMLDVQP